MLREPTAGQSIRLTDQQTLHFTMLIGQQPIPLAAQGYRCQTDDLWRLLLAAAARRTSLAAVCADLAHAPDANTVRGHLTAPWSTCGIPTLEQQWNTLLQALIPPWLCAHPQEIAIDFHDEPYYGREP